ncbi:hypothetical protein P7C70_g4787, partial [Phenoliferia sp. Uapishka_3]
MQSLLNFGAPGGIPTSSSSPSMALTPSLKRAAPSSASTSSIIALPTGPDGAMNRYDLSKPFDRSMSGSPEVLEELRQTILQLQSELQTSNKRFKMTPVSAAAPSTSSAVVPSAAAQKKTEDAQRKADEKKLKSLLKKLFDGLKKGIKAEKWQGGSRTIKVDEVLEAIEFAELFGKSGGTLIQPTPTNNPKSTVTIMSFSRQQIVDFFGTEWKVDALKGHEWTVGGIFTGKSIKGSLTPVDVSSMEVSYSKGTFKATLKFECSGGRYTSHRGGYSMGDYY